MHKIPLKFCFVVSGMAGVLVLVFLLFINKNFYDDSLKKANLVHLVDEDSICLFIEDLEKRNEYIDSNMNFELYVHEKNVDESINSNFTIVMEIIPAQMKIDGNTALTISSFKGYQEIVFYLISKGSNVNVVAKNGITPLLAACFSEDSEIVKLLLEHGANPNIYTPGGMGPLLIAAMKGDLEMVNGFLGKGAKVNQKFTGPGITPLMVAVNNGHLSVAEILISAGANVNEKTSAGVTPLMLASQHAHLDLVRLLIKNGAYVNEANILEGSTPLLYAAMNNDSQSLKVAEQLINAGADIEKRDADGLTPLAKAAYCNNPEMIKFLLAHNAKVFNRSDDGTPPLIYAVISGNLSGNLEPMKILLNAGVDINEKDDEGATAMIYAGMMGDLRIVNYLISEGADITLKNNEGHDAYYYAKKYQNRAVMEILRKQKGITKQKTPLE